MDNSDFSEFYLTLPSNSSRFNYRNNTKSNFITDLIEPLKLNQPYEVALVEIIIPKIEINNVLLGKLTLKNKITKLEESSLIYSNNLNNKTLQEAVVLLNTELKKLATKLNCIVVPNLKINSNDNTTVLSFNKFINDCECLFSGEISTIFGFDIAFPESSSSNLGIKQESLLSFSNNIMYIYSDIIKFQYVGDLSRQLLKNIFIDSNEAQFKYFTTPHYVPLIKNFIDSVKITIKDSKDEMIKFISGSDHVLVKLHFRPQRYGF